MVPVILRISLQPALQRLIRAVRCQRRITAPGRDRVDGCPACNNVVGRYDSITGTWLKPMGRQGDCTPGTLSGLFICFYRYRRNIRQPQTNHTTDYASPHQSQAQQSHDQRCTHLHCLPLRDMPKCQSAGMAHPNLR